MGDDSDDNLENAEQNTPINNQQSRIFRNGSQIRQPGSSTRTLPEHSGSPTRPLPEQPGSSTRPLPEQPGSSTRPLPEQPGSSTRPLPEQPGSSTRPLPEQPRSSSHPQQPSQEINSSTTTGATADNRQNLRDLFPNLTDWQICEILESYSDMEEAASFAAEISEKNEKGATMESLEDVFSYFEKKLHPSRQTLRVEEKHIFSDVLAFYKGRDFDPTKKLRVIIENGPGIDAGGLTRHMFDVVFQMLRKSDGENRYFEGERFSLLPICSSRTALSEIFIYIGKIIGHALLHGIRVIQIPTVAYFYIATQDITQCLEYLDADDVSCEAVKHYVNEIINADQQTLKELAENAELLQYIEESGETSVLTESTKQHILQSLIVYDVLIKRRTSYDQLRQGLEMVGVLQTIKDHKELCKPLLTFTTKFDDMSPENMLRNISCSSVNLAHGPILSNVIHRMNNNELKGLLKYSTGSDNLNVLKDQNLFVNVKAEYTGVFSSTCLLELTVAESLFEDEDMLLNALKAVIVPGHQSFNTA